MAMVHTNGTEYKFDVRSIELSSDAERLKRHKKSGTFGKVNAQVVTQGSGYSRLLFTHTYDGEKNFGEIGPARSYLPDYQRLRVRSWQAMLESEIAQIVVGRFVRWVIGDGLKLQSEPARTVLKSFGIDVDVNSFTNTVESFYSLYCDSKQADYAKMLTKNDQAVQVFTNAIVGGDCLVVLRLDETNTPTIQAIDGAHLQSPYGGSEIYAAVEANGNRIENGIELSPTNEHIAYWVRKPGNKLDYERIPAKGKKTGITMAFLVYGNRYRLDTHRGIPLIAVVLETIKKLDRYKEATVGSAEERQKIAYVIEHGIASDGENPLIQQAAIALGREELNNHFPIDDVGEQLANKIAATTNKQTYNMPIDASLKSLESKNELYFKDFYTVNINLVCACVGIPPNVALSDYNANYSASRAAIQDWAHTLKVVRKTFTNQFERPVFAFWFHVMVLQNIIQAPGFVAGWLGRKWMIMEAYLKARFVGSNPPHIDPLKEVQAVRLKLGATGAALPLTTLEQATEELGGGGSNENMEQYADELKRSKEMGIEMEVPEPPTPPSKSKDDDE